MIPTIGITGLAKIGGTALIGEIGAPTGEKTIRKAPRKKATEKETQKP